MTRIRKAIRPLPWIAGVLVAALLIAVWSMGPPLTPQVQSAPAGPATLPPDLDLVPRDAAGFVSVQVADLIKSDFGQKLLPKLRKDSAELLTNIEKWLGVPLDNVERVTVLMHPEVAIVRTAKPYDKAKLLQALTPKGQTQKYKDKTLYLDENKWMGVYLADERVFLKGPARGVQTLLSLPPSKDAKGPLSDALAQAADKNHLVAGINPAGVLKQLVWAFHSHPAESAPFDQPRFKDLKDLPPPPLPPREKKELELPPPPKQAKDCDDKPDEKPIIGDKPKEPTLQELLDELPMEFLPYKPLFQAQSATLVLNVGDESKLEAWVVCADEETAKDCETAIKTLLYVARELVAQLPGEIGLEPEGSKQLLALFKGVQTSLKSAAVQRKGAVVQASAGLKADPVALAQAFVEIQRGSSRANSSNNLKQIAIAMHNHHAAYNCMPAAAIYGQNGQPLLSWRVAILPFIEGDELYKQFKLDEPWDSEHNKKLLTKMPKIYAPVHGETKVPGGTYYQVFTGQGSPFNQGFQRAGVGGTQGPRLTHITDGTANTILVVEAGEAVPWTKPDDIVYDPKKTPKLGGLFVDGFHAALMDGSVVFFKKGLDDKMLHRLIHPSDGEVIDWDKVQPLRRGYRGERRYRLESRPPETAPGRGEGRTDPPLKEEKPPAKEGKPPIKD